MKVAIIILHFGALSVTQKCVKRLYALEKEPFSLIIINNTPEKLHKKDFGDKRNLTLINSERNLGFASGVNVGIAKAFSAKAEYILLLNNDTSISKPILHELSQILRFNKKVGIVGPAIRFRKKNKVLYDIGGQVNWILGRTSHKEVTKITNKIPRPVMYVSGCCMMIKRDVFKEVGFFDEKFFLYYEDVDFCLRALDKKFETYIVPNLVIDHQLSTSAGKVSQVATYYQTKSAIYFGKKYFSGIRRFPQTLFVLFQALLFTKANPHGSLGAWRALL